MSIQIAQNILKIIPYYKENAKINSVLEVNDKFVYMYYMYYTCQHRRN